MTTKRPRRNGRHNVILTAVTLALLQFLWPMTAAAQTAQSQRLSDAQLEQLVAPIALYPDNLLSQVLMASTYPLEVVEAARWSSGQKDIGGEALKDAMAEKTWDPSVKALAAVPQTLQMMSDKLEWTQQLGDAFLAQQPDVLDAVQRLRQRAEDSGNLKTTPQQKVSKSMVSGSVGSGGTEPSFIAIEPVEPELLYVPIYDPGVIYGTWPYADYPPFYWYPRGFVASNILSFAAGVAVGAAIWGNVDWRRRDVNIDVNRYNQFNRTRIANNTWNHDPSHRGSVPYRDRGVAQKFGDGQKAAAREGFRDRADTGRRDLTKAGAGSAAKNSVKSTARSAAKDTAARRPDAQRAQGKIQGKTQGNKLANKGAGARERAATRPRELDRSRVTAHPSLGAARPHAVSHMSAPRVQRGGAHARGGGRRR